MREKPSFSVITVVLNDLDGLKLTSRSLEEQSMLGIASVEHIIVDGGSADGTVPWLQSEYRPQFKVDWSSGPDDGIYDAMNHGGKKATGDLIVFMNAGDTFSGRHVLEDVASGWVAGSWRWGYGAMRYVDPSGAIVGAAIQYPFNRRRLELGFAFAPHQATYVARDLFSELSGFDLRFEYAADQEFAMRAAAVAPPITWLAFQADFLQGGAHTQTSYFGRERIYHRARLKNGRAVAGSVYADRAFTFAMGLYRTVRQRGADAKHRLASGRARSGRNHNG